MILINELNRGGSRILSEPAEAEGEAGSEWLYYDVNNDGYLTPLDAIRVINVLNDPVSEAEGEAEENPASRVIVALEPIATAQKTSGPMAFSPSAAIDPDANVQQLADVISAWETPAVEDELVDLLAIDSRVRSTDGDAQLDDVIDLLSADEPEKVSGTNGTVKHKSIFTADLRRPKAVVGGGYF